MTTRAALIVAAAGRRCAVACAQIREVLPEPLLDRPPAGAPVLAGMMTLSGRPVPVLDLDMLFGAAVAAPVAAAPYRHLLLTGAGDAMLAWRVSRVEEMRQLDMAGMRDVAPDRSLNGCVAAEIATADGVLHWLDLDRLLIEEERQRLAALRAAAASRLAAWGAPPSPSDAGPATP